MARRPERPKNRGRDSEGPLDWLNEDNSGEPVTGNPAPGPRADPYARPDPGPQADPRPHPDPAAPVLGRRAARAQREALQAAQGKNAQAPAAQQPRPAQPQRWTEQTQAGQGWIEQTQAGQAWTEQTQAGQAWTEQSWNHQTQAGPGWEQQHPAQREQNWDQQHKTQAGQNWDQQHATQGGQNWNESTQAGQGWATISPVETPPAGRPSLAPPVSQHAPAPPVTHLSPAPPVSHQSAPAPVGPHAPPARRDRNRAEAPDGGGFGRRATGDPAEPEPAAARSGPRRRRVAIGLTIAALLLGLWSATSFIDSASLPVAGLAAIAPLVTIFALPVIAVGVASKHVVPTAIAVVAAMLPWTLVTGYAAAGPGRHVVGSDSTLRVMAVDGADGRASAKDIAQVTRLYEVDVVVVTELTNELAHDLTVAGLGSLAPSRWVNVPTDGSHGTGLWSRPNINELTPITGLSQPGVDGAIEAGPTKIGISVVHLAGEPLNPGSAWRGDLKELGNRPPPADESFIVGDLNAGPWQPAFRRLTSSKWRDAANVVGQGLRPTWPSWSPIPIAPVDHVLVSPGLGVVGADTTNIAGSTHRALIVTLIIPHAGG